VRKDDVRDLVGSVPVLIVASAVMVVAFGLSWLLRDVPLRESVTATQRPVAAR